MTQIKLRTSDQHLIVTNRVKIAKGDINSVDLRVYLDSAWDEFPNISAAVENDAVNLPTFDFLLASNLDASCFEGCIPSAYLSKAGTLSISVSGVSIDGTKKKTSTIVKMKVFESLVNAETTIEPELDLYMQYLAALKEELNPTTEFLNREFTAMIEKQRALINGDVLWVNPDTSAEITEAFTIPIDRTQYTRLHIEVLSSLTDTPELDGTETYRQCLCVHSNGRYASSYGGENVRYFKVTDTGVTVEKINSNIYNDSHIPYRIIGYKY